MTRRFPGRLVYTRRDCGVGRCDFRDCDAMVYSLVDLMNLARTKLILGSGYSSYSEVAAQIGGSRGGALPILMAGRDFGTIVERRRSVAAAHSRHRAGEPRPRRLRSRLVGGAAAPRPSSIIGRSRSSGAFGRSSYLSFRI